MALHWLRTQGPDSSPSPVSFYFPNAVTIISRVCLSPQRAAFSVHPWKWSCRTPTNSLDAPGACHFYLPHSSLLSILKLLLSPDRPQPAEERPPRHTSPRREAGEGKPSALSWPSEDAHFSPLLSICIFGHFPSSFCFSHFLQNLSIDFRTFFPHFRCI